MVIRRVTSGPLVSTVRGVDNPFPAQPLFRLYLAYRFSLPYVVLILSLGGRVSLSDGFYLGIAMS